MGITMRRFLLLILFPLTALLLISCGPAEPQISVSDIWGRISPKSAANAAFYMDIENEGRETDRLIGVESSSCGITQIHETRIDEQGVASMQHIEEIEIPASETVSLAIGGLHVMCIDKQREFAAGNHIPITLIFTTSGEMSVEVEIKEE
jgi:copper(I)-binding protein